MKHFTERRGSWQRNAIALGACLCIASIAQAQQTAGAITGRATTGDVVSVVNPSINISREVKVGADGSWSLSQLPAGIYTVTVTKSGGAKETKSVVVSAGQSTQANFETSQTVTVTGTAKRVIDLGSTTNSFGITKAEIDRLPVGKDVNSVALLAPGAVGGDGRFGNGNVVSLGGASPAENAYYINGFNVTNIVTGLAFNSVPFEGIAEQQVFSSGYSVEFGRSLGGVLSINTKRGSNEWKFGGLVDYQPQSLGGSSVYAKKNANGGWDLEDNPGSISETKYNVYAGGPIIKDKLFFFGLVQGQKREVEKFRQDSGLSSVEDSPQYLIKLDWNINEKNLLEFTSFNDESDKKTQNYSMTTPYFVRGAGTSVDLETSGGKNNILKWTGFLTPDFTLSAMYGVGTYSRSSAIGAAGCPAVYDSTSGTLVYKGCWSEDFLTVEDPNSGDERKAFRVDAEWNLGNHQVRFGLDKENYSSTGGTIYSGMNYYRVYAGVAPGGSISGTGFTNNTAARIPYVRDRFLKNGGTFETDNSAWYVEDNWKVSKDLLVNFGIRGESFTNYNSTGESFIDVKNTISPRGGFAWDPKGDGQSKLYGNLGRYYIPVYSNTNLRLAGTEDFTQTYRRWDGTFSTDGKSVPGQAEQLGNVDVLSDGKPRNPATLVDTNLKPMFQDEFVLGFQQALKGGWTAGVKGTYRELKSTMDDFGDGKVVGKWALANGYSAAHAAAIEERVDGYVLMNPGNALNINVDLDGTGQLTKVSIPASALLLPKPKRTYTAFEFMLERPWDKKWSMQASYVLAYSRGNTEGYVKSDIAQDDAGITQDWDHPSWMEGSSGYLPNDRRHTIKLNGAYGITDEWALGMSAVVQSGRPMNCFGVYNGTIDDAGTGPNSFYCDGKLVLRGSIGRTQYTRDFSLSASYSPASIKGLRLGLSVFNLFDERGVRAISETGEDASGGAEPNYKRPSLDALQKARSFRMTAAYEF